MALDRSVFVISLTTYSFSDLSLCVVVVVFLQLWFIAALTVCDLDAIKTPDRRRIDVRELDKRHTRMHTNKPEFLERSLHVYFVIEDVTLFSCVTCSPFFAH